MGLTAYPVRGKQKSADLCNAFIQGAGKTAENAAVFYGVDGSNIEAWREVLRFNRPFYYIDNAFFDATRGVRFRVAKSKIQIAVDDHQVSDGARFNALGIELKPWSTKGNHIVVCPQSETFMRDVVRYPGDWLKQTLEGLNEFYPHRHVVVRQWNRDKAAAARSLPQDLADAHALVTHSSMAAVTAIIHGVPARTAGMHATCGWGWKTDRLPMLHALADAEWSIDELKEGMAWAYLNP